MSLLCEVLQVASKASTDDLKKHRDQVFTKIKDLTERVQLLSWSLQQNIIDTFVNFSVTKSLEQLNYNNRKANIISDHEKLTDDIKSFVEQFDLNDVEFNNHCDKLKKCYELFHDLCTVAEGKRILDKATHEFDRFNYSEAMLAVKHLKIELEKIKFDGNMAKALENMIEQSENQLALYIAQVSVEWEDIFTWTEKKSLKHMTYSLSVEQSDPILLQKILKTLYVTDRIYAELGLFSRFFMNNLLHNVIRHNCNIFTEDHIGAIVFNIKIDMNDPQKPSYQTIFNNLTAIFEFLHTTLGSRFDCNKTFIEVFAEMIRQKFFNKIIEDCIRMNLPSCDSSYQNYKNIVVELDSFNKFLIDLKFVKSDESPLNKYIDDTECVLYNKKCDKLLSDVRTMLNESLSYGTISVGSEPMNSSDSILDVTDNEVVWDISKPLLLPKCVISQNVKAILSLIVEHLEESVKLPEKYRNQLVAYVKDVAVMYQSFVPKKFKVNLECCPSDIAIFFNNCFYLAHGLLGPPWCSTLPRNLASKLTIVLLECIQDLRVLGLEKMSLYLQNQKNTIMQSIETSESTEWSHETYEQFDCAINRAVTLMQDLKCCWLGVLPARMYVLSLCALVQALCQSILDRVLADNKPISEELVYVLAMRMDDTAADILTLFVEPITMGEKINVWSKFTRLPRLLRAQLLEISHLWNNEKDQCQGYTCEEVRQIVKMRFPDDKYRLKILKEIQ